MRVLETGGELDLPEKALDALRPAELGANDLHRHRALMAKVSRQIDRRHAPGADLTLEDVPAGQGGRETLRDVAHRAENLSLS
jgi:hypothetical protein